MDIRKQTSVASSVQDTCSVGSICPLGANPYKAHQGKRSRGGTISLLSYEAFFLSSLALDTPMEKNTIVALTYSSIYTIDAAVGVLSL